MTQRRNRSTGAALGVADVPDWLYEHVEPQAATARPLHPTAQLKLEVILSAVDDLQKYRAMPGPRALCLWGHAIVWIRFPDDALPGSFSFRDCAEAVGIDVAWAAAKILDAYGHRPHVDRPALIHCEHSGAGPGQSRICPIAQVGHSPQKHSLGPRGRAKRAA